MTDAKEHKPVLHAGAPAGRHGSFTGQPRRFDYCRGMDLDAAALGFAAIGQATRLDLLRALLAAAPAGLSAGELAGRLGVPASTLSFHLRRLEQAGLIAATRPGRSLIYTAQTAHLRALITFLTGGAAI